MSQLGEDIRRVDEARRRASANTPVQLQDEPVYLRVLFNHAVALLNAYLYERAHGNEHQAQLFRDGLDGLPADPAGLS